MSSSVSIIRQVPYYTLLVVISVNLLATAGEAPLTWTSPVLPKLYSKDVRINPFGQPINSVEDSWIVSLVNIGAVIGPFPFGAIAQKFGRKTGLFFIALLHIISYLTFAFSKSVYFYYVARLLGGVAMGGGYTLLPMYIGEISENSNRGMFSATLNIFWTLADLICYVVGYYLSVFYFNIVLASIPLLFLVFYFIMAPETPYYLAMRNKDAEAEKVLMKLRSCNKHLVEREIENIHIELAKNSGKIHLLDFFKSKVYMKGLIIAVVIIMTSQFTAIDIIESYTEEIFTESGATFVKPEISAMIIGLVTFLSSVVTLFLIDTLGRRIMLLIAFITITLCLFVFGVYLCIKQSTYFDVGAFSWLPLFILIIHTSTFHISSSVCWTVSSELFPTNVKTYAASLVSCTAWITSFLMTKFFNDLKNGIGEGETFCLFGGLCFMGWVFILFFMPETKRKSFHEIQNTLKGPTFQLGHLN